MPKITPLPLDAHNADDLPTSADVRAMDPNRLATFGPEINLYRANLFGAALREYATLQGSLNIETTETVLRDFVNDARHFYDALRADAANNDETDADYNLDEHLRKSYPGYLEECDRGLYESGAGR